MNILYNVAEKCPICETLRPVKVEKDFYILDVCIKCNDTKIYLYKLDFCHIGFN